ncbi:HTH_Tnp_Tc3_2 domain-containing protein [Trichonephila clavipes]|nr:HTH_Tnp_Tc3_2 domain-containing protein [Trichonephila clavipes]
MKKCLAAGFELMISNCQSLKEVVSLDWKREVDNGRFQSHDGSSQPRATADQEDRLIVISAAIALYSSLLIIIRTIRTRVSSMNIHRRLIERNLRSYRPLQHLPFTPPYCGDRLQWCLNRSG